MNDAVPMLRPVLFLATGIVLGRYSDVSFLIWSSAAILFLLTAWVINLRGMKNLTFISANGILLAMVVVFTGAALYTLPEQQVNESDGKSIGFSAKVYKVIKDSPERSRVLAEIEGSEHSTAYNGFRLLMSLDKPDKMVLPGDRIVAYGKILAIPPPSNPGQFDVRQYYAHKWVYLQTYLYEGAFQIQSPNTYFNIWRLSYQTSLWIRKKMKQFIPGPSAATMQAIFLGTKSEISDEMMETYQEVGVMHILAVSGMHVGFIYLGFIFLLKPFIRKRPWLTTLPVILVWIFSFITGAGPAVLRAALMLTFVDIGRKMGNTGNTFNLLLVSAFVLLVMQPYLLWDIGFQLSYAALIGILLFMQPLNTFVYTERKWVQEYLWQPTMMSVSAQLGTQPLVLYYFGIFPVYFLLSNFIVLAPVFISMFAAIALIVSALMLPDVVTGWIGHLIYFILQYGFDKPLIWMNELPNAVVKYLYLDAIQVVLFWVATGFLAYWIYHIRNGKWLVYSCVAVLIMLTYGNVKSWWKASEQQVWALQTRDHKALMMESAYGSVVLWTDSILRKDIQKADFDLEGIRHKNGWRNLSYIPDSGIWMDDTFLVVKGKSIMQLHRPLKHYSEDKPIRVDYLFLSDHTFLDTSALKSRFAPGMVVLDGSISPKRRRIFSRLLQESGVPFHDTKTGGALEIQ
jgi:competence protein ComEC